MGADCKSADASLRWFEPTPAHPDRSLLQEFKADITQLVEFHPSKVAVVSSNLIVRSFRIRS